MNNRIDPQSMILPYAGRDARTRDRVPRLALAIAWAYPVMPLGGIYFTWLVAWLRLGHPPREMIDDPASLGPIVSTVYYISAALLVTIPLGLLLGTMLGMFLTPWWVQQRGGHRFTSTVLVGLLLAAYVGSFAMLRWDPLRVLSWFMD